MKPNILGLLYVLILAVAPQPMYGQAQPVNALRLDTIRALVDNHTPDTAIAGEITSRGLVSAPNDDWINDLQTHGAGQKTIEVLRGLVSMGDLTVITSVPDCDISIDGRVIGRTDAAGSLRVQNLRFGSHSISVRKDRYFDSDQTILVSMAEVSVSIRPVSAVGSLTLATNATGALISIAGMPTYTGQVSGLELSQGTYTTSVSAPGHEPKDVSFEISGGRPTIVNVRLETSGGLLIDAMGMALSKRDYRLAAGEASELLTIAPNNGQAYFTLAQAAFYTGNVNEFFENMRKAIQNKVQVPFTMIHVNEKAGAHKVIVRIGLGSIWFENRGSAPCSLPQIAIIPAGGGISPSATGRAVRSQVQNTKVTWDKFGEPVLELAVSGHAVQFVDALTNQPGAVSSRNEYEVIQAILQGTGFAPVGTTVRTLENRVLTPTPEIPASRDWDVVKPRDPSAPATKPALREISLVERAVRMIGMVNDAEIVEDGLLYPGAVPIHVRTRFVAPHYIRQDSGLGAAYTDGITGWLSTPSGGRSSMSMQQVKDLVLYNDLLGAARNDLSLTVNTVGDDTIYLTTADGQSVQMRFDKTTGLPRDITHPYTRNGIVQSVTTTFSDWRIVNGIRVPFRKVTGTPSATWREDTVVQVRLNFGLTVAALDNVP